MRGEGKEKMLGADVAVSELLRESKRGAQYILCLLCKFIYKNERNDIMAKKNYKFKNS